MILIMDNFRQHFIDSYRLAVANSISVTFLHVFGSELIQKYLGDGPKLVRELFRVADELSPSIVFIDEIEALGRPLDLTFFCIGISPVYQAIFQPFSHIISKRLYKNNTIWN
ncbi:unnamed protein product [Musa banksii]